MLGQHAQASWAQANHQGRYVLRRRICLAVCTEVMYWHRATIRALHGFRLNASADHDDRGAERRALQTQWPRLGPERAQP